MRLHTPRATQVGFTLIETMIASMVLIIGVLGVAAMLGTGLAYMSSSQAQYIAQEKAAEAVESVFEARDIGQATWSTICNVGSSVCTNGVFLTGSQTLCGAGTDGILGTADDYNGAACAGCPLACPDSIIMPSAAGVVNSTSGTLVALTNFKRTITISSVLDGNGNTIANLRQITVTITYSAANFRNQTYTLNAYISNFS